MEKWIELFLGKHINCFPKTFDLVNSMNKSFANPYLYVNSSF